MKKGIIALSILCTGLLLLDPLKNISFASKDENLENKINSNVVTNIEENNDKTNNENNKEENKYYENNDNISNEKENIEKDTYEENKKEDVKAFEENENEYIETSKEDKEVEYNVVLDKEEAENILKGINPELKYIYQGDENNFSALKEKNLTGYVFLPDVETDIGYFIDKTNSNVYFFHPSGYLELVK